MDFSNAEITVTDESGIIQDNNSIYYEYSSIGTWNSLLWKVPGYENNVKYTVTIDNVKVNGAAKKYTYYFKVIDGK